MAGTDASIILGVKPVQLDSPLDSAQKAASLSSLMQEQQMRQMQLQQNQMNMQNMMAQRQAYANNTTQGPNGPQLNQAGVLSDLANTNPMAAFQLKQQFDQQNLDQMQRENQIKMNAMNGATEDNWADTVANLQKQGVSGADKLPQQWPGDDVKNSIIDSVTDHGKLIEQQQKQQDLNIRSQEAQIKAKELGVTLQRDFGSPIPDQSNAPKDKDGLLLQDPADLVKNVPQSHQQKVFDEITAAQNTARNAPKIMQAFDDAANHLHAVDFVPGVHNADQKALHALMGPTFQDVEGTVRQAAMDNMNENTTPQFGDSEQTIKTKRAALVAYLESKQAAPTAKGFGIDLSKFSSTKPDTGGQSDSDPIKIAGQHSLQDLVAEKAKRTKNKTASNNQPKGNND